MKTDQPLKLLLKLRPTDMLRLAGHPDDSVVESVDPIELAASLRVDTLMKVRYDGATHYHVFEMQAECRPEHIWRWFGYGTVASWYYRAPVVVTVVWLFPPGPGDDEPHVRFEIGGREVNRWRFEYVKLWELPVGDALAGPPGLAVLSPLAAGGDSLDVVRAAARRIESAAPEAERTDLLAILGVLAGRRYTVEELMRVVGRDAMIQSSVWDAAVAEGIEKGIEKGRQEGSTAGHLAEARELCEEMVREYHPGLEREALVRIHACDDVAQLRRWVLRGPCLDAEEFVALLGLR